MNSNSQAIHQPIIDTVLKQYLAGHQRFKTAFLRNKNFSTQPSLQELSTQLNQALLNCYQARSGLHHYTQGKLAIDINACIEQTLRQSLCEADALSESAARHLLETKYSELMEQIIDFYLIQDYLAWPEDLIINQAFDTYHQVHYQRIMQEMNQGNHLSETLNQELSCLENYAQSIEAHPWIDAQRIKIQDAIDIYQRPPATKSPNLFRQVAYTTLGFGLGCALGFVIHLGIPISLALALVLSLILALMGPKVEKILTNQP